LYQGDQDVDRVEDAVINDPDDIDAGLYKFRVFVAPKVGMKYAGVEIAVTNSGVDFEELLDA
jgi:hypothetical protein